MPTITSTSSITTNRDWTARQKKKKAASGTVVRRVFEVRPEVHGRRDPSSPPTTVVAPSSPPPPVTPAISVRAKKVRDRERYRREIGAAQEGFRKFGRAIAWKDLNTNSVLFPWLYCKKKKSSWQPRVLFGLPGLNLSGLCKLWYHRSPVCKKWD
jgi:hypothetical protein